MQLVFIWGRLLLIEFSVLNRWKQYVELYKQMKYEILELFVIQSEHHYDVLLLFKIQKVINFCHYTQNHLFQRFACSKIE